MKLKIVPNSLYVFITSSSLTKIMQVTRNKQTRLSMLTGYFQVAISSYEKLRNVKNSLNPMQFYKQFSYIFTVMAKGQSLYQFCRPWYSVFKEMMTRISEQGKIILPCLTLKLHLRKELKSFDWNKKNKARKKWKNPSLFVLISVKSEVTEITASLMENANGLISDKALSAIHQPELQAKQCSYCPVASEWYYHGKWEY